VHVIQRHTICHPPLSIKAHTLGHQRLRLNHQPPDRDQINLTPQIPKTPLPSKLPLSIGGNLEAAVTLSLSVSLSLSNPSMAPAMVANGDVSVANSVPALVGGRFAVYSELQRSRIDHALPLPRVLTGNFQVVDGPNSSAAGNPGFSLFANSRIS